MNNIKNIIVIYKSICILLYRFTTYNTTSFVIDLPWEELAVTLTSWVTGDVEFAGWFLRVSRARFCWWAARCIRNCCSIFSLISSGVALPLTSWSPDRPAVPPVAAATAVLLPPLTTTDCGAPERLLVIIWALAFSNLETGQTHQAEG